MKIIKAVMLSVVSIVVLSAMIIVVSVFMNNAGHGAQDPLETQAELNKPDRLFMTASDFRTRQAQAFTQFGVRNYFDAYWQEIVTAWNREKLIEEFIPVAEPEELSSQ